MKRFIILASLLLVSFNSWADYFNSNMVEKCRPIAEAYTETVPVEEKIEWALCYGFFASILDLNITYSDNKPSIRTGFDSTYLDNWFPCKFEGTVTQYVSIYVTFIDKNPQYLDNSVMQVMGLAQEPYCR